ncbi:MAG: iron-containing alcohol dehydrogenase [Methyloligellaceae bacterium]
MSILDIRQWNYPTRIVFGEGAIERLPELCASLGMKAPLLVTDSGLRDAAITQQTVSLVQDAGLAIGIFSDVKGNPTLANVEAGIAAYTAGGHDSVIAFGGGSGLDAAKTIAFMSKQTLPVWHFDDAGPGWQDANADDLPPVIAIPTTAGTGSEVGRAAVISNEETKEKKIIFHPGMMPEVALCDPALTRDLPPHLTAATGFDALVHCFEAFCAPGYHPMADGIALEGVRLAGEFLPRAVASGHDMEARAQMMSVAAMGATAFQKGLGGIHALSHAIGALHDTHHGLTNAVVMPYIVKANEKAIGDHMERLSRFLGLERAGFAPVFDWLLELRETVGIPHTATALGVDASEAEELGARAVKDPTAAGNPVQLTPAQYAQVFVNACAGTL